MIRRQFIAVKFRPGDLRAYTYHNDGEPVAAGDRVLVESRGGGQSTVTVVVAFEDEPPFETKPIIGRAPDPDAPQQEDTLC